MKSFLINLTVNEETDYSLWKTTKRIKRPIMSVPPIRKGQGNWARENKQRADMFADYLAEVFIANDMQN